MILVLFWPPFLLFDLNWLYLWWYTYRFTSEFMKNRLKLALYNTFLLVSIFQILSFVIYFNIQISSNLIFENSGKSRVFLLFNFFRRVLTLITITNENCVRSLVCIYGLETNENKRRNEIHWATTSSTQNTIKEANKDGEKEI